MRAGKETDGILVFQDRVMAWSLPDLQDQPEQLHEAGCNRPRITGTGLMTISTFYMGCDISKSHLDFYDTRDHRVRRIGNTKAAINTFIASLVGKNILVVMEATGSYDRILRQELDKAGLGYARINPMRARRYAEAIGTLAKTDALDARLLADMGATLNLVPDVRQDRERERLGTLQKRRDQLVQMRSDEQRRRHEALREAQSSLEAHIEWLSKEIKSLNTQIASLIDQTPILKEVVQRLQTAPGVGPVTAGMLVALLPELGVLSPKKIASLAGMAPMNHDSGAFRGIRRIKGGRPRVRRALYMAALSAIRTSPRMKAFYERIAQRAKAKKVAIIAVARKLLTCLNAMLRDQKAWA